METREELLKKVMEYKFAVNDLALYLDTHPNDRDALRLHNNNVVKLKEATNEYQNRFGPLTFETQMNRWEWVEDKWPWERGYN